MSEQGSALKEDAVRDASAAYSEEVETASTEAVPPGYKRTEVGVIPEVWTVKPVSHVATVKTGPFGSALHQRDYVEDGTPIVTVEHLGDHGLLHENVPMVSDHDRRRLSGYELRAGDIVFSRVGSVDRNSLVHNDEHGWLFSGRLLRVRITNSNVVDPRYLSYHFHSEAFKQRVRDVAVGQTMASLNTKILNKVLAIVPRSIEEQRAIAIVLSDADALIESLDRLIAKKRAIKQAAMQQLLTGQTRLPGFTGEWETKRLGEISTITMGRTPSRSNSAFWGHGHTWLSIADLNSKVVSESKEQITDLAATGMTPIPKGTLLMSFKLSIGRLCFAGCDLFTNEAICSFTNLQADAQFLYYMLGQTDFSLYGKQAVKGYTLNSESLNIIEVRLPEETEQSAIATVLSDMDAEIEALEHRRDKARQIKQGMMQELLTGRTRLVEPVLEGVNC